jgi:hypothetical protein
VEANDTRNQHFLTRVEQKLNANAEPRNLRIYSFEIVDRESYILALESPNGRAIGSNLSLFDLFSFDVPDTTPLRLNFERLFQRYETSIEVHTKNLLAKLNRNDFDIKTEIIDLFAAKLLNFVRNPFSIAKVLNSFPGLTRYDPADPTLLADYRRIVSGRKPHQSRLCTELGISDTQYAEWLRLLFMLLTPMMAGRPNLFEEVIKTLLEDPKTHVAAFVCEYDSERCLLSDRGFSQPIEDGPHMAFSFNLCATAFVDYIFADPATLLQGKASPEFIARARRPGAAGAEASRRDLPAQRSRNARALQPPCRRAVLQARLLLGKRRPEAASLTRPRKPLSEIKELLAGSGPHLGVDLSRWLAAARSASVRRAHRTVARSRPRRGTIAAARAANAAGTVCQAASSARSGSRLSRLIFIKFKR